MVGIAVDTIVRVEAGEEHPRHRRDHREHDALAREPRRVRGADRCVERGAAVHQALRVSAAADQLRERLDAVDLGGVAPAQVLHEQAPEERRDHVGRRLDVGVGREVVGPRSTSDHRARHASDSCRPTSRASSSPRVSSRCMWRRNSSLACMRANSTRACSTIRSATVRAVGGTKPALGVPARGGDAVGPVDLADQVGLRRRSGSRARARSPRRRRPPRARSRRRCPAPRTVAARPRRSGRGCPGWPWPARRSRPQLT